MTITNQTERNRSIIFNAHDIANQPRSTFSIFSSYLSVKDQAIAQRVSARWNAIFHSDDLIFTRVQSIAITDEVSIKSLCEIDRQLPTITKKFHEKSDPSGKILTTYVNRMLRAFLDQKPENITGFLNKLSSKVKAAIQFLNLSHLSTAEEALAITLNSFPNIKTLDFTGSPLHGNALMSASHELKNVILNDCQHITNVALKAFFEKNRSVETLSLSGSRFITGDAFENFDLPNLKELELSYCEGIEEEDLKDLLGKAKNLERLDLSNIDITGVAFQHFDASSLKELDLSDCESIEEDLLKDLLSKAKNLERLILNNTYITGDALQYFDASNLKELDLSGCEDIEEDLLKDLLSKAKNLERLTLNNTNVKGDAFQYFDASSLKELDLSDCEGIEEDLLKDLLSKAKNLERLTLNNTKITGDAFQHFDASSLKELDLSDCKSIE
ncbi:MAG: hypothetical protein PVI40_08240, partial [Chlamydiota bacterium]